MAAVAGKVRSGVGGRNDDQVDFVRRQARIVERAAGGGGGEVGRVLALGRDVALLDADALLDPLVGGVDGLAQLVIGHDALGQVAADAAHDRPQGTHAGFASLSVGRGAGAAGNAGNRCMPSEILSISRLRAIS